MAQLAQLPEEILARARVLLENFEAGNEVVAETQKIVEPPLQMSLFTEEEPIAPAGAEAGAEVLKN